MEENILQAEAKTIPKSGLRRSLSGARDLVAGKYGLRLFLLNFILVNLAYFVMHYFKRGTWALEPDYYFDLLFIFYGIWFGVSLISSKFILSSYPNFKTGIITITKANIFILYSLSFLVVLLGLYPLSRVQIFGTCAVLYLLELAAFTVYYYAGGQKHTIHKDEFYLQSLKFKDFSLKLVLYDFFLVTISFYVMNYFKRGTFELTENYQDLLLVVYALWLVISVFTRKFERKHYRNFYYAIAPHFKAIILMVAVMSVLVFAFRMFYFSRLQILGAFGLLIIFESVFHYFSIILKQKNIANGDIESIEEVKSSLRQEILPLELDLMKYTKRRELIPVTEKLRDKYLNEYPKVFRFIKENVHLNHIDEQDNTVLNTHTLFNIETIDNHTLSLLINLHKLNDFRWLNRYFLEVHKKIYNGGYFVSRVDSIKTHRERFDKKYPWIFAKPFYYFDFLVHRVLPKLPGIQRIYFLITRGRNRVLSKAEVLGRLYFCGFKVVAEQEIYNGVYIISQRVKNPSLDRNPSYGPTIKMRRVGFNGEINHIYKFRTMYPYSEYLQEYVFEQHNLRHSGKFHNDFRLTEWGGLMRKLWIDELPQIINFFRGDLSLVGVRALSEHYFSLYPPDLQQLRIQFKPGLVPPYYADMPKSFDQIIASERQYLRRKQMHPFSTDVQYFFKATYNILFKKARSQ